MISLTNKIIFEKEFKLIMGFMTTITILNDAFDQIQKDPEEFVDQIQKGLNGITDFGDRGRNINTYGIGNYCNPIIISKSQHADVDRLYLVGGNMMTELGYFNDMII
jgi:hypothetical protein